MLFEYALRLHRLAPDSPLPRDGYPLPDDESHRRLPDADWRRLGMDVASVLDAHLATDAPPSALAEAFHHVPVPGRRNEHVVAAALRGDRQRVRDTGRWLVRRATDRCAVLVGLALLAAHAEHLGRQEPAVHRYETAGFIVRRLMENRAEQVGCTVSQRDDVLSRYRAVLDREGWRDLARAENLTPYQEPR